MLWVMLVYHPYRFDGRVETAPEAVSVFVKRLSIDHQRLHGHPLEVDPTWRKLAKTLLSLVPTESAI